MTHTKPTSTIAPCNIDLDQHDGLVVQGHRDCVCSEKQDMIGKSNVSRNLSLPGHALIITKPPDWQNHIKCLEKELGDAKKNLMKGK